MSESEPNGPISKPAPGQETASILDRIEALERAREGENDLGYKKRQICINIWPAVLTGCLVVTSVVAIYISIAALDAAKKSADVAAAALETSSESFRIDERAWVEIEPIKPVLFTKADGTFGASFRYKIYPKNVGKTVARDIVMQAHRVSSGHDMGDNANAIHFEQERLLRKEPIDTNRMAKVLAPNTVSAVPFVLDGQEPQNGWYSVLIGRIDYVDAFSIKHWMTFCYIVINSRGELMSCKEGNDEDRNPETLPAARR